MLSTSYCVAQHLEFTPPSKMAGFEKAQVSKRRGEKREGRRKKKPKTDTGLIEAVLEPICRALLVTCGKLASLGSTSEAAPETIALSPWICSCLCLVPRLHDPWIWFLELVDLDRCPLCLQIRATCHVSHWVACVLMNQGTSLDSVQTLL